MQSSNKERNLERSRKLHAQCRQGWQENIQEQNVYPNADYQEGLHLYEQMKQSAIMRRKLKKEKGKAKQYELKLKNQPFKQVIENESRLANEKILKNKGLIKKRKKMQGNSRVHLRLKYKKALSKHRSKGHYIKQNPGRVYGGQTNIKFGQIKSTKLK